MTQLLRLDPIDSLFFRGGRPFGPATRAVSGLPKPQTVAGALRTSMLRAAGIDLALIGSRIRSGLSFGEAAEACGDVGAAIGSVRFRGPWLGHDGSLMYPVPATLRREEEGGPIVRLDPLRDMLPGWQPRQSGMKPLWSKYRQRLKRIPGCITECGMVRYRAGSTPRSDDIVPADKLYGFDDRTGIGLDSDRGVAADGMIYAVRHLVLCPGVNLFVEVSGSADALLLFPEEGTLLPLGGEGRRVVAYPVKRKSNADNLTPQVGMDGQLIIFTTPALLNGWCPDSLKPIAAAVPGYEAVSGWDLARGGPKPNRFAVCAGTVFFVESVPGTSALSRDSELGWGSYLAGYWRYT